MAPMKSIAVSILFYFSFYHFLKNHCCLVVLKKNCGFPPILFASSSEITFIFKICVQISRRVTAASSGATMASAFPIGGGATVLPIAPTTRTRQIARSLAARTTSSSAHKGRPLPGRNVWNDQNSATASAIAPTLPTKKFNAVSFFFNSPTRNGLLENYFLCKKNKL